MFQLFINQYHPLCCPLYYFLKSQENINSSVEVEATSNDPPADAANQDDGLYSRVELLRPQKSRTEECSAVSHEEVQYSTIQHHHVQQVEKTGGEDDVQYASVSFSCTTPDYRSTAPEDPSVIYSGVK
ncbi:hypothetical protein AMEX_G24525 [Astyanax mexicanus]|uniref:Uncharacterized protein n=1 Tax=Astyanax mexicanus TaxID=7994 RepID=A0A8T2L084_ASTMX|nr:hypothetical protein AMEX_G24525 [Astyanax mexicanus]